MPDTLPTAFLRPAHSPAPTAPATRCPSWAPGLALAAVMGAAAVVVAATLGNSQSARIEARLQQAQTLVTSLQSQLSAQFAEQERRVRADAEQSRANEEQRQAREQERARQTEQVVSQLESMRAAVERELAERRAAVDSYLAGAERREREWREASAAKSASDPVDPATLSRDMLLPTVQLNGDDTVGSGTIVFSGVNPRSNQVETYVLTSYHVVRNILNDTPSAFREGFDVTIYLGDEKVTVKGKMIAAAPKIDAGLVLLDTHRQFENVARTMSRKDLADLGVWDPVCAIGCPLGNDPVPSLGILSSMQNELNGANYWMVNAPTYFGNSGGGVYAAGTRELIGVFSKIYTHGKDSPVVVPHMGLLTPMSEIRRWLEEERLAFVLAQPASTSRPSAE